MSGIHNFRSYLYPPVLHLLALCPSHPPQHAQVVRKSGIPEISVQSLRRTWENLLRAAGVPDLVRRSIAGWRTKKAQAIYADVKKKERDAASNAVLRLVEGI